ncbi:hypothetical protein [[Mycobacterium] wendilense]|uniref:Mce-associated membrane protein n=1 Tax=[Mycobacterium] wendilense TaxID=3064284 RepID=A0ABN9NZC3_9MYCO|nr:hypothetical protein [Mycolicibacterium sp. MU0050]CAJ1579454.1 hypothetical protein MU0050_000516 [Mycolicibacterium sp. MU0050]
MADSNPDDVEASETAAIDEDPEKTPQPAVSESAGSRQISLSVRSLLVGGLVAVLLVAVGALAWLYLDARSQLDAQARQAADNERAQQVAMDYAVSAAQMDFRDLAAWKARLVAGTSPELSARLGEAADSMEQILTPLQWESTAKPVAAIVRSSTGGVYVVDAFVSVLTKTTQSPQGLQSTATYSITLDADNDWQITDVGGIDAALGGR